MKGKILFVQSHGEDELRKLKNLLEENDFLFDELYQPITFRRIKPYTAIALANPKSRLSISEIKSILKSSKYGTGLLFYTYFHSLGEYEDFQNNVNCAYKGKKLTAKLEDGRLLKYLLGTKTSRWGIGNEFHDIYFIRIDPKLHIPSSIEIYESSILRKRWKRLEISLSPNLEFSYKIKTGSNEIKETKTLFLSSFCYDGYLFLKRKFEFNWDRIFKRITEWVGWKGLKKESIERIQSKINQWTKALERVCIVRYVNSGRFVGICSDIFDDKFIREKGSNFKFALKTLEFVSEPALHKIKTKKKRKILPFAYF